MFFLSFRSFLFWLRAVSGRKLNDLRVVWYRDIIIIIINNKPFAHLLESIAVSMIRLDA